MDRRGDRARQSGRPRHRRRLILGALGDAFDGALQATDVVMDSGCRCCLLRSAVGHFLDAGDDRAGRIGGHAEAIQDALGCAANAVGAHLQLADHRAEPIGHLYESRPKDVAV